MVRIEFEDREVGVLARALQDYVSDLRMQVANTDSQDFRDDLKDREKILKSLIHRLERKAS